MPTSKREIANTIAALHAELAGVRRQAQLEAESAASGFNSVVRDLEAEIAQVSSQRDEALARLALFEKKAKSRPPTSAAASPKLHAAAAAAPAALNGFGGSGGAPGGAPFGTPHPAPKSKGRGRVRRTFSFEGKKKRQDAKRVEVARAAAAKAEGKAAKS